MDSTTLTQVRERLRSLVETSGENPSSLSVLCGLNRRHLRAVLEGERPEFAWHTAVKVAEATGCTLDWLLRGIGAAPQPERLRKRLAEIRAAIATAKAA